MGPRNLDEAWQSSISDTSDRHTALAFDRRFVCVPGDARLRWSVVNRHQFCGTKRGTMNRTELDVIRRWLQAP